MAAFAGLGAIEKINDRGMSRMATTPSPPAWQVILAVVLTSITALCRVWAGGKIFRTGLLMQGKTPTFAELSRWVMTK